MKLCAKTYLLILILLAFCGSTARAGVTDPVVNALDVANYYIGEAGSLQEDYIKIANDYITAKNGPLGDLKAAAKASKRLAKLKAAADKVKSKAGKVKDAVAKVKEAKKDISDNVAAAKEIAGDVKTKVDKAKSAYDDAKSMVNNAKDTASALKDTASGAVSSAKEKASNAVSRTPFAAADNGNITVMPGASTKDESYKTTAPQQLPQSQTQTIITQIAPPQATVTGIPVSSQQNTAGMLADKFAVEPAVSEVPLPLAALPSADLMNQTSAADIQARAQVLAEEPQTKATPDKSRLSLEDQLRGEKEPPKEPESEPLDELLQILQNEDMSKQQELSEVAADHQKAAEEMEQRLAAKDEAKKAAASKQSSRRAFGAGER